MEASDSDDIDDLFDQKLDVLSLCLEAVENGFQGLTIQAAGVEDELAFTEEKVSRLRNEGETARGRQHLMYKEVGVFVSLPLTHGGAPCEHCPTELPH